ncbi:hypothetical protein GCM10023194_01020 [Planotetraspora phitsanulokensis]|uniref:DUF3515 domain-containing protein n=1 Tax=Planotetraspora phitsanulokensis TaxID=575192 RepID=A0A8J3U7L4_9ACTN|nr:DUF3515 domain-containing protein [Planotetraspora phitsanulokensis]GII40134.1 hypothetical protein Pph01_51370 [Planotetraspora phitsanulokensis]
MPKTALPAGAAAAFVALTVLAGCSGVVRVEPPTPTGAAAAACRKLAGALPHTLDGLDRVASEPASPYVAVWGEGEIALRCGVERPAAMPATAEVSDVDGVGWFNDPQRPALYTAVNREAYVELTISPEHRPAEIQVDLAGPIKTNIPQ